ncbi:hypothetical protein DYB38_002595 [Aphanomyces astaci]|uniref:NADPH-dependent FMN reductase-like domain-containing protein n=1 Tax=Aphanomyces astaci TaxID=112090 RepID=A0A397DHE2_APHAT|nr:hypothetical protein DYB38_002595 [Aphanomyces astaci]
MPLTVSIVLGSVRPGRQGLRVAKYLQAKLDAAGFNVHLIDPLELNLPLFVNRFAYLPAELKSEALTSLQAKFEESDAFVVITPEYNHTFSPVIKELPFPVVQNVLNEDGALSADAGASGEAIESGTKQFVNELKWYAAALKTARAAGGP